MGKEQQSRREISLLHYEDAPEFDKGVVPWPMYLLGLIEWAKQWNSDDGTVYHEERLDNALVRDELLATGKFAEELDRQNVSKREKVARVVEFYDHLCRQNDNKHERLDRKLKYVEEREHLDWIKNKIEQGAKNHKLKTFLEHSWKSLNSVSDRLLDVLFTYEEIRLWLQTKPDIAAELNIDLSHEVAPDDLRDMLTAALFVGTFIPTGKAAMWVKHQEKTSAAKARGGKALKAHRKNKKIIELAKKLWEKRRVHQYKSNRELTLNVLENIAKNPDLVPDLCTEKERRKDPELKKKFSAVQQVLSPFFKMWKTEQKSTHAKN